MYQLASRAATYIVLILIYRLMSGNKANAPGVVSAFPEGHKNGSAY